jgi:hypothetical protein
MACYTVTFTLITAAAAAAAAAVVVVMVVINTETNKQFRNLK